MAVTEIFYWNQLCMWVTARDCKKKYDKFDEVPCCFIHFKFKLQSDPNKKRNLQHIVWSEASLRHDVMNRKFSQNFYLNRENIFSKRIFK